LTKKLCKVWFVIT